MSERRGKYLSHPKKPQNACFGTKQVSLVSTTVGTQPTLPCWSSVPGLLKQRRQKTHVGMQWACAIHPMADQPSPSPLPEFRSRVKVSDFYQWCLCSPQNTELIA